MIESFEKKDDKFEGDSGIDSEVQEIHRVSQSSHEVLINQLQTLISLFSFFLNS